MVFDSQRAGVVGLKLSNGSTRTGNSAKLHGDVQAQPAERVILVTGFSADRVFAMLVGEQLPRIC